MIGARAGLGILIGGLGLGAVNAAFGGASDPASRTKGLEERLKTVEARLEAVEKGGEGGKGAIGRKVRAERFELVNRAGEVRGAWEALPDGDACLWMFGKEGDCTLQLHVRDDGGAFVILGRKGMCMMELGTAPGEASAIGLFAKDGKASAEVNVGENGGATMYLGRNGVPSIALGASPGLPAQLSLLANESVRVQLSAMEDCGRMTLASPSSTRRIELEARERTGTLHLYEQTGKTGLQLWVGDRREGAFAGGLMIADHKNVPRVSLQMHSDGKEWLHLVRANREIEFKAP